MQTPYVPLWRFEAALCPGPVKAGVPTVPELHELSEEPAKADEVQQAADAAPEQEEQSKVIYLVCTSTCAEQARRSPALRCTSLSQPLQCNMK